MLCAAATPDRACLPWPALARFQRRALGRAALRVFANCRTRSHTENSRRRRCVRRQATSARADTRRAHPQLLLAFRGLRVETLRRKVGLGRCEFELSFLALASTFLAS
jgi:hypothetical protein